FAVEPGSYTYSRARAFFDRLQQEVGRLPGVQHVAIADGLPGATYSGGLTKLVIADKPTSAIEGDSPKPWLDASYRRADINLVSVTPGFLETLGLPLRQ